MVLFGKLTLSSVGGSDGAVEDLAAAILARDGWTERLTARVGDSDVVHAVTMDEQNLPRPACNTGIGGWDPRRLRPMLAAVTCERCRKQYPEQAWTEQLALSFNDPPAESHHG